MAVQTVKHTEVKSGRYGTLSSIGREADRVVTGIYVGYYSGYVVTAQPSLANEYFHVMLDTTGNIQIFKDPVTFVPMTVYNVSEWLNRQFAFYKASCDIQQKAFKNHKRAYDSQREFCEQQAEAQKRKVQAENTMINLLKSQLEKDFGYANNEDNIDEHIYINKLLAQASTTIGTEFGKRNIMGYKIVHKAYENGMGGIIELQIPIQQGERKLIQHLSTNLIDLSGYLNKQNANVQFAIQRCRTRYGICGDISNELTYAFRVQFSNNIRILANPYTSRMRGTTSVGKLNGFEVYKEDKVAYYTATFEIKTTSTYITDSEFSYLRALIHTLYGISNETIAKSHLL